MRFRSQTKWNFDRQIKINLSLWIFVSFLCVLYREFMLMVNIQDAFTRGSPDKTNADKTPTLQYDDHHL